MKEIWILSIRTSLPGSCVTESELSSEFFAYDTFEKAREALYDKYMELVYERGGEMFENGVLICLDDYIDSIIEPDIYEKHDFFLTKELCNKVKMALHYMLYKKRVELDIPNGRYSDGAIELSVEGDRIELCSADFYATILCTNALDMTEQGDYYLYIDDSFSKQSEYCKLYIDLKQAELE